MRSNKNLNFKKSKMFTDVLSTIFLSISISFLVGCGDNLLESLEDTDRVTDASIALDEGDPSKAIELCYEELGSAYKATVTSFTSGSVTDSAVTIAALEGQLDTLTAAGNIENPRNVASILASAYAQRAGVDMVDVALNLASSDTQTDNTVLVLGDAINSNPSQDVLDDMELAIIILRGIGTQNYRGAESYKDSIFQMAHLALFTSSLPDLTNLTTADALEILDFLDNALSSSAGTSEDPDSEAQASLDAINDAYTSIGVLPGDTDAEKTQKVQDFLNGN
jgi:hypothetical protein